MWLYLVLCWYAGGFVWWYRNRYRSYLNSRDKKIAYNDRQKYGDDRYGVVTFAECKTGALLMAIFWPLTVIPWLLSLNVKTDKQIQEDQAKREQKIQSDRDELRLLAKALEIPGWD